MKPIIFIARHAQVRPEVIGALERDGYHVVEVAGEPSAVVQMQTATLRDQFAMAAPAALGERAVRQGRIEGHAWVAEESDYQAQARARYEYADAMLAERAKRAAS